MNKNSAHLTKVKLLQDMIMLMLYAYTLTADRVMAIDINIKK